jgi:hypothetical protein
MAIHTALIHGCMVYYESQRHRIVDAIGTSVVRWDLRSSDMPATIGTANDPRGYIVTRVEAGTASSGIEASDEVGFVAELATDNLENDGLNMQLIGKAFRLDPNRDIYYGIALQADDVLQSDFLAGLCITTTDALGAGMTDGILFRKLDGVATIAALTVKDSNQTLTADIHTMVANTTVTLEFYCTGTTVGFYVNGAHVVSHATTVVDDEVLTPTVQWLAGATGVKRLKIAWARAFSLG